MNDWPSFLLERQTQVFALQVAIGGVLLSAVVLLAARLLKRRSAPLRYGVLFAGVVGLLAAPAFVGVGQRFQGMRHAVEAPIDETVRIPVENLLDFLAVDEPEAPPAVAAASPWSESIGPMLLLVWALGIVIGLARLMRGMWMQRRALVGVPWQADWWTDAREAQLAHAVGLRQFPEVFQSPAAPMPLVFGLLHPTIVLPEQAPPSWGQTQWEAVLLHEAAHIARRDPWAALVQQLGVVLFWWCPLVHVLARRLNHLREQICDDYALQGACDGIAYAELLIESAEALVRLKAVPVPVALLDSARGGLEDRITRLLQKERKPMTKLTLPGKLLGAACLVTACLLITAGTAFTQGTAPQPKKIQVKIIVDGKEIDLNNVQIQGVLDALPQRDEPKKAGQPGGVIVPVELPPQAKPDPRIEELVRAAEAIKPGSGAEIRRALQGKVDQKYKVWVERDLNGAEKTLRVWTEHGPAGGAPQTAAKLPQDRKIIIIEIRDGKVIQLQGPDVKMILDQAVRDGKIAPNPGNTPLPPTARTPDNRFHNDPTKKATPPTADNTEALLRQLERINAELQDLRAKLHDSQKRQAK
jgi:beta-lactamase regulating signal transducer with metallopeptidase domain